MLKTSRSVPLRAYTDINYITSGTICQVLYKISRLYTVYKKSIQNFKNITQLHN